MYGVMTERSVAFTTSNIGSSVVVHHSTSMSSSGTSNIQDQVKFKPETTCDSAIAPTTTTATSSVIMPALLHKRKRLDQVLTKLSMSSTQKYSKSYGQSEEPDKEPSEESKSPQKQLSLDSEMSMTVENLKLEISESGSIQGSKSLECSSTPSSTATTAEMMSPTSTIFPYTGAKCGSECAAAAAGKDMSAFNTGSDLLATTISMSALFTPPTSDSAGGTAEFEEEYEDHAKNDQHDEVSDTTTATTTGASTTVVMMHSGKCTLDSGDNLFSSEEVAGSSEQLLKKLPQAKLLSHDSAQKISENAHVPDVQSGSRMLKCIQSSTATESNTTAATSSSLPICVTSFLNKLPYYGLATGHPDPSLPTFPICKCSHCVDLADQTSSKMPPNPSTHCWSTWFKQDIDPFHALLAPHDRPTKVCKSQQLSPAADATNQAGKKRSHSDSDMISESMFGEPFEATTVADSTIRFLRQTEPGVIVRNGRRVPKPLRQPPNSTTALSRSDQSTPQESPLDLSVKSLSPATIATTMLYTDLLSRSTTQAMITNSSSVPLLISSTSPKHSQEFSTPYSLLSPLAKSIKSFASVSQQPPHSLDEHSGRKSKRRNISHSDSQYSSSLSSVSSLSPLEKQLTDQVLKTLSPLYSIYGDEAAAAVAASAIVKSATEAATITTAAATTTSTAIGETDSAKSIRSHPKESKSLSSLADLDTSPSAAFSCPVCGQSFSLHDRLAKHIASRHKNRSQAESVAKNYLCDVCQRSFARSDMLTRHMRLHTGIKPYTCKICGQVFSRSDHLSTHQRTHTGEKPYKCPQCPYAACRRDMITRHMRTHSRYEMPDSSSSTEELSK